MTGGGILTDPVGNYKPGDDPNQKFTPFIFMVALLSAVGGFLFGYDTGIVSGAMVFIRDDFKLQDEWQEAIISITILGAWMFSMCAGYFSDRFGRKKVVYAASTIFTVGAILMAVAPEKWTLLIGRFVVGAAIGLASMVVPTYIAEMAPAHVRGSLVTLNNLFIAGGQAVAALVAVGFSRLEPTVGWRWMLGVAAVPSIIQFVGFLFMPESPRWLVRQNMDFEAMEVLQKIRGKGANIDEEYNSIKETCKDSEREDKQNGCKQVLTRVMANPGLRRALFVGAMLQMIQQLTGINTVMYYSATIIQMSGVYDKTTALWMASATAAVNFMCNFIGVYLVEKIGRRMLTLGSLVGVIISLVVLAIGFMVGSSNAPEVGFATADSLNNTYCMQYNNCMDCTGTGQTPCGYCFYDNPYPTGPNGTCVAADPTEVTLKSAYGECINGTKTEYKPNLVYANNWCPSQYSWMTLLGLCLYLFCFGPGMGPMPWTINSEIYPLWARSTCYSVTTAVNWFFNLLISVSFLSLTRAITKQGAFWLYASFGTLGFAFFYFMLPETKGISIDDTSSLFGGTPEIHGIDTFHPETEARRRDGSKRSKESSTPF